jgi:hypothetical protein
MVCATGPPIQVEDSSHWQRQRDIPDRKRRVSDLLPQSLVARNSVLDVTWHVSATQNLYHASKVLTGLSALKRKGEIGLNIIPDEGTLESPEAFVVLTIVVDGKAAQNVVIDLLDTSEFVSPEALERADVYFKRSLAAGPLASQPQDLRSRIRPFGLNFACIDMASWADWLAASRARARAACGFVAVRSFASDVRHFAGIPSHQAFVIHPGAPKRPIALFQTRVWPPEESRDNLEQLNRERVELVKQLRTRLGARFVGGVVDSEFARAAFPEAVVSEQTHRRAYAALTRSALVGVYSRGIHGSLAFKLTEYLAAGCCMVAEPFEHLLDIPLESGVHYLPFDSADSCARACAVLLDDARLAAEMSRCNAEYFQRCLLPEVHIARVLGEAVSTSRPH